MNEIDNRVMYLALKSVPGIGATRGYNLISHFGSVKKIFKQDVKDIKEISGIKAKNFEKLFNRRILFDRAKKELDKVIKKGYGIVTYEDETYPPNLRNIPDPPLLLYYKGNILKSEYTNSVAVVGTRTPTQEGKNLAYEISYDLSSLGVAIVSGLAKGIDSCAHRACVDNNKKTAAVLGSGIDVIYPKLNKALADDIVDKGGVILSEFPMGSKPERYNFPQRNRIIAGLSLGVVVVQSPEDSGALITAKLANEYGRSVFAIPGKPGNKMYKGSNQLIKQGASLVENANDVLEQLKYELSIERKNMYDIKKEKEKRKNIKSDYVIIKKENTEKNEEIEKYYEDEKSSDEKFYNEQNKLYSLGNLTDDEKALLAYISDREKKHIDQLCIESGMDITRTGRVLTSLLLKDFIDEHNGKYYTLKPEN